METFSIMEPCCIGHQLPQLLKKYPLATWQSNGDVTFDKLMKAISCLAGNSLTVKIVIPTIDIPMLRLLLWYRQREWLKEVAILTKDDQTALMRSQLGMDFPLTARHHDSVVESLLVIEGEKATVIVQGADQAVALRPDRLQCGACREVALEHPAIEGIAVFYLRESGVPGAFERHCP